MPVITLSSEIAAFGEEFADRLADHYLSVVLDKNALIERFIAPIATEHELHMLRVSPKYYLTESAAGISFKDYLEGALNELSSRESVILYNCGGQFFLKDNDAPCTCASSPRTACANSAFSRGCAPTVPSPWTNLWNF